VWRSLFARVGFAKLLHWLRHNPEKRDQFASAFEHCDMVAATLCGVTDPKLAKRSVCAMGHKWMWNPKWDGLPPQSFLSKLDRSLTAFAISLGASILHRITLPGISPRSGPRSLVCGPASRCPSEHSTHTGTQLARAVARETSSTWLAPPPASLP